MVCPVVDRRSVVLAGLAAAFLTACPLSTFEVDGSPGSGGSGGASTSTAGSAGAVAAGRAGGGPTGAAGEGSLSELLDDHYAILQGETLSALPSYGVLANDAPRTLEVVAFSSLDPPEGFEDPLEIRADGSFDFHPSPRFFGIYRARYTAENPTGDRADAEVEIRVVPTSIELESVAQGIGGFLLEGATGDALGVSLDGVGDIDRDGKSELILGAPGMGLSPGAAYLVLGKEDLEPIDLELLPARTSERRFLSFEGQPGDGAGVSVAGLGDLDEDGSGDVVIGASGGSGQAYIVFTGGLVGGSVLSSDLGYALAGDNANSDVGRVVSGAGDVNGDGVLDVLVSSRNVGYGWIHVVYGDELRAGHNGPRRLSEAPGLKLRAARSDDAFPLAAVRAMDVDADGYHDVFLASHTNFLLLRGGTAYPSDAGEPRPDGSRGGWSLQRGGPPAPATVARAGDADGDGSPDVAYCEGVLFCKVVFGPPSTLASGWTVSGFARGSTKLLASGGGDLDGDGLADLLFADDDSAYVVYGKTTGHAELNVAVLGSAGYALRAPIDGTITSIAVLGDVNGDGISDLAIGDASANSGAGRVYVVFGVFSNLDVGPD